LTARSRYRARQFRRTLAPNVTDDERRAARAVLGPSLFALFVAMQPADQRHCLDVYELLRSNGESNIDVLIAALIHDAGKAGDGPARIRIWHRVLHVALPDALVRLFARGEGGLSKLQRHGEETLAFAREAGAPDRVISLLEAVELHNVEDERAARLLAADDAC